MIQKEPKLFECSVINQYFEHTEHKHSFKTPRIQP